MYGKAAVTKHRIEEPEESKVFEQPKKKHRDKQLLRALREEENYELNPTEELWFGQL